jgi:large subunit ribosomal protein L7/L12
MSKQLERVRKKEAELKALRQKLEAAEKTRERKKDVRRKILLGAMLLEHLEAESARGSALKAELEGYLTREADRALFGLLPLEKKDFSEEA